MLLGLFLLTSLVSSNIINIDMYAAVNNSWRFQSDKIWLTLPAGGEQVYSVSLDGLSFQTSEDWELEFDQLNSPNVTWDVVLRADSNFDSSDTANLQTETWGTSSSSWNYNNDDVIQCEPSNTGMYYFRATSRGTSGASMGSFRVKVTDQGTCNDDLAEAIAKAFLLIFVIILVSLVVCVYSHLCVCMWCCMLLLCEKSSSDNDYYNDNTRDNSTDGSA